MTDRVSVPTACPSRPRVRPDRVSVPTSDIMPWLALGWAVVCPDFDRPQHTLMRWAGTGEPRSPFGECQ